MPPGDEWEEPDPDSLMRSERKHEWISEPRYRKMFDDIEHALQGVMGKGPFEWVDRRVFDQVFDRHLMRLLRDTELRRQLAANSAGVCDGLGAGRVAEAFLNLIGARDA